MPHLDYYSLTALSNLVRKCYLPILLATKPKFKETHPAPAFYEGLAVFGAS